MASCPSAHCSCVPTKGSGCVCSWVPAKLVASKQEAEIAKVGEKALKAVNQQKAGREPGRARPSPYQEEWEGELLN